ncbi:energy transducer TonB [Mucilaginibacter roseus]|uniref:Energy transducer TonB n=1 Tax=Mucilaginibacter roseus TaxID=1528868 RepID=A0ABS8U1L2_9SPHI|nr:energy transducer TonB [Mucilaginibacter roseus]MCD8739965.1 energy transducer TonB [Mucilaginibacter roseus]
MIKFTVVFLTLLYSASQLSAQDRPNTDTVKTDSAEVFYPVEVQPSFPGGFPALYKFVSKGVTEANVSGPGRVFLTFIVQKDGSLTDIKVAKSLSEDADKAAIKIMAASPKWEPGISRGKPCRVQYTLPITFK